MGVLCGDEMMDDGEENMKSSDDKGHSGFWTSRREEALPPCSDLSRLPAESILKGEAAKMSI